MQMWTTIGKGSARQTRALFRLLPVGVVSFALLLALAPVCAAELTPESVNSVEWSGKPPSADRISPLIIRVQVLLARAYFHTGRFTQASEEYSTALKLAPGNARALIDYANFAVYVGHTDDRAIGSRADGRRSIERH